MADSTMADKDVKYGPMTWVWITVVIVVLTILSAAFAPWPASLDSFKPVTFFMLYFVLIAVPYLFKAFKDNVIVDFWIKFHKQIFRFLISIFIYITMRGIVAICTNQGMFSTYATVTGPHGSKASGFLEINPTTVTFESLFLLVVGFTIYRCMYVETSENAKGRRWATIFVGGFLTLSLIFSFAFLSVAKTDADRASTSKALMAPTDPQRVIQNINKHGVGAYGIVAKEVAFGVSVAEAANMAPQSRVATPNQRYVTLKKGANEFRLKAGEETPWLLTESCRTSHVKTIATSHKFKIVNDDGTEIEAWKPESKGLYESTDQKWKYVALEDTIITAVVS